MQELSKDKNTSDQQKLPQGTGGTIVINNSTVGAVNSGQLEGDIDSKISVINNAGSAADIGDTLTKIKGFLQGNQNKLTDEQYKEALEMLNEVAKQATLSEEQRSPLSILRTITDRLGDFIKILSTGDQLWKQWGPAISEFFGF